MSTVNLTSRQGITDSYQADPDGMMAPLDGRFTKPKARRKPVPHCDCHSVDKKNPGKFLLEPIPTTTAPDGTCAKCGHEPVWL